MTWTPTAENINKLEPGLREYIMRLSTDEKRAGLIAKVQILEGQLASMNKMLEEAPVGLLTYDWLGDTLAEVVVRTSDTESIAKHRAADLEGKRVRLVVLDE